MEVGRQVQKCFDLFAFFVNCEDASATRIGEATKVKHFRKKNFFVHPLEAIFHTFEIGVRDYLFSRYQNIYCLHAGEFRCCHVMKIRNLSDFRVPAQ